MNAVAIAGASSQSWEGRDVTNCDRIPPAQPNMAQADDARAQTHDGITEVCRSIPAHSDDRSQDDSHTNAPGRTIRQFRTAAIAGLFARCTMRDDAELFRRSQRRINILFFLSVVCPRIESNILRRSKME